MSDFNLHQHSFENEKATFVLPTWDQIQEMTFSIAQASRKSGKKYDRVVTLAKGGWPMTRSLVDFLHVEKVASIGVKFYSGVDQRLEMPEVYQDVPTVKDENILLFDDVADTGESLIFAKKQLEERGAASVDTATLFYKKHSKLKPDFFATETDSWVIFPYEVFESIKVLSVRWQRAGLDAQTIRARLIKLGFAKKYLDQYFLS